ncbi:12656_t:CDS:2, partial [Gigaspora rosea]
MQNNSNTDFSNSGDSDSNSSSSMKEYSVSDNEQDTPNFHHEESSDDDSDDSDLDVPKSPVNLDSDFVPNTRAKAELKRQFETLISSNNDPTASMYANSKNNKSIHRSRLHSSIFGTPTTNNTTLG